MNNTRLATINHWDKDYTIEYEARPVTHRDATRPCGNGVWLFDEETGGLWRWSLTSHELPYHYRPETWNLKGNHHLVVASSEPLWVWWGEGCDKLKWGDSGIALPKIKKYE